MIISLLLKIIAAVSTSVFAATIVCTSPGSGIETVIFQPEEQSVDVYECEVIDDYSDDISDESYDTADWEVDLLARLIYQEAGCDWIPDEVQLWVGSVVLNRINSSMYPDNLYDVIYQPGQYGPAITGSINNPANDRAYRNAAYLLEHGSVLPSDVLFQSGVEQGGGTYAVYYDEILQTIMYFCYP